jgi:repressor LexA
MALTRRQKEFLDFLAGFLEKRGYSPSYEEIADGLSLASLATVHKHILALETKNYVTRSFNRSRSLELTPKFYDEMRQNQPQPASMEVPLLGRIAAGAPVEAIAGQDTLSFSDFVGDPSTYALKVRGESMIEDHICDGDFVLVERATDAREGDIVVALVGSTWKRAIGCDCSRPMRRCSRFLCRDRRSRSRGRSWRCCASIREAGLKAGSPARVPAPHHRHSTGRAWPCPIKSIRIIRFG